LNNNNPHFSPNHQFVPRNGNTNSDRYHSIKKEDNQSITPYGVSMNGVNGSQGMSGLNNTMNHGNFVNRNPYGTNAGLFSSRTMASSGQPATNSSKKSLKKHSDKGSEEYKKRRERNNVAVRKSREKAKLRSRDTEKKVSELLRDNDQLRKRLDLMASQMNVMKQLLTSVGVPSESIDNEINRNLQMEGLI
jgi:hypothetical protein